MLTGGACAATIRVLSSADLKPLLTFAQIIDQAERAYAWKSEGLTSAFPLVFHEFAPGTADMDIKSGHLKPAGIFGMKLVSFFETNIQKGIAPLNASIMLYDDTNGLLRAVIEGAAHRCRRSSRRKALGAAFERRVPRHRMRASVHLPGCRNAHSPAGNPPCFGLRSENAFASR